MRTVKTQFTMRFDLTVQAKLKKIAEKERRSMANMIEYLVAKEIAVYAAEHGEIKLSDEDLSLK